MDTLEQGRDDAKQKLVRVGSYGGTGIPNDQHIHIHGLQPRELEIMLGMMGGAWWVTNVGGRIEYSPVFEDLPDRTTDEDMLPFWRRPVEGVETQLSLFSMEPIPDYSSPSITIQHLCGYFYSPEGYTYNAGVLERYGFECLRSKRGLNGKYWELWFLPGLWAAQGELKEVVEEVKDASFNYAKKIKAVVSFLCRKVSFGTLDVSVQRAAMPVPD